MTRYIARRILIAVPTLLGITMIIFLAMRILPGDVASAMFSQFGSTRLSDADRATLEKSLGLSKPLYQQYGEWLRDISTLKLGESFWRGDKVIDLVKKRGILTLQIAVMSMMVSWMIGIPVGILSALRQNTLMDYVARVFTVFFLAVPTFWLASLITLVLLLQWGWKAPPGIIMFWDDPVKNMQITWGPILVLGLAISGYVARMTRSTMLEVIHEDYIRTARAKGLREQVVVTRHSLRNAMLPVINLSGVIMGLLLGGSVVTEVAFGVKGLGFTLVNSFNQRDIIVIQNLVLIYGVAFMVTNLLTDVITAWLDPRIRLA